MTQFKKSLGRSLPPPLLNVGDIALDWEVLEVVEHPNRKKRKVKIRCRCGVEKWTSQATADAKLKYQVPGCIKCKRKGENKYPESDIKKRNQQTMHYDYELNREIQEFINRHWKSAAMNEQKKVLRQ